MLAARDRIRLGKFAARVLRHEPLLYELELDDEGWTSLAAFLAVVRRRKAWRRVSEADFDDLISRSDKRRYEIADGRIRALYGHSIAQRLRKTPGTPPDVLYHGTSSDSAKRILAEGLDTMSRQYVHLSTDVETAIQVGGRKASRPTILEVDARRAHVGGGLFYVGNEQVWLADHIPPEFIEPR